MNVGYHVNVMSEQRQFEMVDAVEQDEISRVLEWRYTQLVHGGYGPSEATELATHVEIDLHEALDFLLRGCPPDIASRILI